MAADVAKFSAAIDKVHKDFVSQEIQLDQAEMKGLGSRGTKQYLQQKFLQQLQRARAAFLQEFRNHSVVVETEVRKIREELTKKFEETYGERISKLKAECDTSAISLKKSAEEIARLKSLVLSHESYIDEVRPRLEVEDKLRSELLQLKDERDVAQKGGEDLGLQLNRREELVSHLTAELKGFQGQLKSQAETLEAERLRYEDHIAGLQDEMHQQQQLFQAHLKRYEESFEEYKVKARAELQIQEILLNRRAEALAQMEEERQRHIKARTKPSSRIGPAAKAEASSDEIQTHSADYELLDMPYRVDDMGMDTAWRDYDMGHAHLMPHVLRNGPAGARGPGSPPARPQMPKFQVERVRKAAQRVSLDPIATATDTPRPCLHVQELQAISAIPMASGPRSAR